MGDLLFSLSSFFVWIFCSCLFKYEKFRLVNQNIRSLANYHNLMDLAMILRSLTISDDEVRNILVVLPNVFRTVHTCLFFHI